jgi:hypothetical protein
MYGTQVVLCEMRGRRLLLKEFLGHDSDKTRPVVPDLGEFCVKMDDLSPGVVKGYAKLSPWNKHVKAWLYKRFLGLAK